MSTTKNRRKLLRKINVNNTEYIWSVSNNNCDGDGSSKLQIWNNKIKIFEELIQSEIITPKKIKQIIINIK
jgi:hypothetical protein